MPYVLVIRPLELYLHLKQLCQLVDSDMGLEVG